MLAAGGYRRNRLVDTVRLPRSVHLHQERLKVDPTVLPHSVGNATHGLLCKRLRPVEDAPSDVVEIQAIADRAPFFELCSEEVCLGILRMRRLRPFDLSAAVADRLDEKSLSRCGVPVVRAADDAPVDVVATQLYSFDEVNEELALHLLDRHVLRVKRSPFNEFRYVLDHDELRPSIVDPRVKKFRLRPQLVLPRPSTLRPRVVRARRRRPEEVQLPAQNFRR